MIHILLIILKIIGIILLSVLGLAVLLVLTVLFVPVRYRADADVHSRFNGKLLMSWLGRVARLEAVYDKDGLRYVLRFLWFTLLTSEEDEEREALQGKTHGKPKQKRQKKSRTEKSKTESVRPEKIRTEGAEPDKENACEAKAEAGSSDMNAGKEASGWEAADVAEPDISKTGSYNADSAKNTHFDRIRRIFSKLKQIPAWIKRFTANASEFKDKTGDRLEKLDEFIHDEANREFVRFMKKELGGLFTHIAPVRYNISIRFGAGSPDITGKVTGAAAVAMAFFIKGNGRRFSKKNSFEYIPVFTDNVFEADVFMKGRITPGRVLLTAWRVYRNERFGQLVLKRR